MGTSKAKTPQDFSDLASAEGMHRLLLDKLSDTKDFAGVNIFDADGKYLNSSERWPVPSVNLSDRRFFQTFKSDPNSSSVLIQRVDSRISNGSTIVVARKVTSPSGTFLGMITRSISPEKFESFFSTILLTDSALALVHGDGSLLARYPLSDKAAETPPAGFLAVSQASIDGNGKLQFPRLIGGQDNITSASSLEHYPIYVVAEQRSSVALASWSRETWTLIWAALLVTLVVGIMLVVIIRYLKEQHRRLNIAVSNMAQGLLLFDASERLVLCNQQYLEMFGLSSDVVRPGCSLREVILHRQNTGSLTGDVEEYCEKVRRATKSGSSTLTETPDGRWMQIVNKSVEGGGWVSTMEDVTEQHRNEERSIRLASYDTLTELPNRALLRSHLENELEQCNPENQVAVLFLDMDDFKAVNDTLGHRVGDELLKSVARNLQGCVGPHGFVARLGGDEFAVVLSGISGTTQVTTDIERIYQAVRQAHECASHRLTVDTSIGIAVAPHQGSTCDELLQNADLAMYDAKSSGKRTHRFFEARMEKKAKDRRQLEIDLRMALAAGSIEVHYQPLVDLQTDQIVGCEALARWTHAERGYVSPAEFIPVAEQSGLIEELGEYVLRLACREAAIWPKTMKLAVNVSPVQFKSDAFALKVVAALAQAGLSPNRLELEITEAVLIGDDEQALEILHELKSIGVRVALDDFGTGYSSLSYLRRFPFDKIKIDRSFVKGLTEEDSSYAIIRAVVAMAAEHEMITTAEGVETEQQKGMLRNLQCDEMQGFLFSVARTGVEIRQMVHDRISDKLAAVCA